MSSSVANELFNGCTCEFYVKVHYKITCQNLRYNLNMKYAENKKKHTHNNKIKDKRNKIIKREESNLDASTAD